MIYFNVSKIYHRSSHSGEAGLCKQALVVKRSSSKTICFFTILMYASIMCTCTKSTSVAYLWKVTKYITYGLMFWRISELNKVLVKIRCSHKSYWILFPIYITARTQYIEEAVEKLSLTTFWLCTFWSEFLPISFPSAKGLLFPRVGPSFSSSSAYVMFGWASAHA